MLRDFTRAGDTGWGRGACSPLQQPPTFCVAKRKKGDKDKKERVSKQKLLKGCHQGQNITVLAILERLEFKNFLSRPTMVAENTFHCSMAPTFKSISPALFTDRSFSLQETCRLNREASSRLCKYVFLKIILFSSL